LDVIVPAANAAAWIGDAIAAVKEQDYPNVSIIVAAADSATADEARRHGARVIDNPDGNTPAGLNRALADSDGEIVARVDAHSIIPPGYLTRAVATLLETGADNVGGMQIPVGKTTWERAIATAMASPLGAGDARYRIGGQAGPVETVYLGVFRRSSVERVGGFDEAFKRNQDYELNHRIRKNGGMVWFDPNLKVGYRPRGSLSALRRQYFQYGRAKRAFARKHLGGLRWRQLAPPTLVIVLISSLLAALIIPLLLLVPTAYLFTLMLAAAREARGTETAPWRLAAAWATMHIAWGTGFLSGSRA
jgi:glycosyltransferase involved in cell wall biosynthesis